MGMSQLNISPAGGSYEGPYDGLYQRPRDATRLAEADPAARGGEGGAFPPLTSFRQAPSPRPTTTQKSPGPPPPALAPVAPRRGHALYWGAIREVPAGFVAIRCTYTTW